jgi:uncharacterized protein YlxW (UPF0749 family)
MLKIINEMPHNGELLARYLGEYRGMKSALAKNMEASPSELNAFLKHASLQTSVWWRVSQALKHNFFAELGELSGLPYETKIEAQLREELARLQQENEQLKTKIEVYETVLKK